MMWLAEFKTTPARIVATIAAFGLTVFAYLYLLLTGQDVSINDSVFYSWLGFLSLWAGIDVAQFHSKRTSDYGYMERKHPKVEVKQADVVAPGASTVEVAPTQPPLPPGYVGPELGGRVVTIPSIFVQPKPPAVAPPATTLEPDD